MIYDLRKSDTEDHGRKGYNFSSGKIHEIQRDIADGDINRVQYGESEQDEFVSTAEVFGHKDSLPAQPSPAKRRE
ncbi:hypothetical protein EIP86_006357 [Pleurotus ostreatoroseus]|nr:hypothetical protein EIP86_006357 [Pleurotus ostreatoroseus]